MLRSNKYAMFINVDCLFQNLNKKLAILKEGAKILWPPVVPVFQFLITNYTPPAKRGEPNLEVPSFNRMI